MNNRERSCQPLALSLGDPNGLGPDLVCALWGDRPPKQAIICVGPEGSMLERAGLLGYGRFWHLLDAWPDSPLDPGLYWLTPASLLDFNAQPGQASLEGGRAAAESLLSACQALEHRQAKALVTCPLNKAMLQAAGYDFPGHTEFLAQYFGLRPDEVCMHLAGPRLRVSLATTHPPLRLVPWLISPEKIARYLELTWKLVLALETSPRPIAVCGLNPHAGESGAIGDEEQRLITPGIRMAVSRGTRVIGPLAADTVFYRAWQGEFSAVLAMYHDQGLGPLKLVHFGQSVNITLGLPVIRTSVDHGTGYDLVATGRANPQSLSLAVDLATRLAQDLNQNPKKGERDDVKSGL